MQMRATLGELKLNLTRSKWYNRYFHSSHWQSSENELDYTTKTIRSQADGYWARAYRLFNDENTDSNGIRRTVHIVASLEEAIFVVKFSETWKVFHDEAENYNHSTELRRILSVWNRNS